MNWIILNRQFGKQGIVSTGDIYKIFPNFDSRRLVEWQQKGYLRRLANRWYHFTDMPLEEVQLWWAANRLYAPSYLSLETALSFHGLIPEGVFAFTSVSSRKTKTLLTPVGAFSYHHLKPALFFGYSVLRRREFPVLMADPEKTVLDLLYLRPHLKDAPDFDALRLNRSLARELLDGERLATYGSLFDSPTLTKRLKTLTNYLHQDA